MNYKCGVPALGWKRRISFLCAALLLLGSRSGYAFEDNRGRENIYDEGIPGVLKYAQQYQREKSADLREKKKQKSPGQYDQITNNAELHRILTVREQELRQLKKENHALRDRLDSLLVTAQKVEKSKDKDSQIAELQAALDRSRMQNDEQGREAKEAQGALSQQVLALREQLAQAKSGNKAITEQAEKEKAGLVSSLNVLKKEMAEMPVVTPELLKKESGQLTYAAGVMLGRDMLNIQAAQQQLGLKTDNRVLLAGIRDALNRNVLLNENSLDSALRRAEEVVQKARLTVIREQKKVGAVYLEKFRKQKGVKQAAGGFWYRTEYVGDGDYIRGENTVVDAVVTEKLTDGTVIEDMDARGRVISQALSNYPPVFREALMLLKNHGTAELVVPSELAYGDEGYPPKVLPGATMLYTLRVEDVKQAAGETPDTSPEAGRKTAGKEAEGDNK